MTTCRVCAGSARRRRRVLARTALLAALTAALAYADLRLFPLLSDPRFEAPLPPQPRRPRVAVVTVDNRNLTDNWETAGYWSLSAVINAAYALERGYDYLYLQPQPLTAAAIAATLEAGRAVCAYPAWLLMGVGNDRPLSAEEEEALRRSTTGTKDVTQAVHIGRGAFRAASWAKLPALWSLGSDAYDAVLFVDSDAFLLPGAPAFEEALLRAELVYGAGAREASIVTFGNRPYWREDMPTAGVFMWRPGGHGLDLLRRWWDGSGHDRKHAYEQDVLWDILDGAGKRWEPLQDSCRGWATLNGSSVAAVGTQQFADVAPNGTMTWPADSWVRHIGHGSTEGRRVPEMRQQLEAAGVRAGSFAEAIAGIRERHLRRVDSLAATLGMHAATCAEARRCAAEVCETKQAGSIFVAAPVARIYCAYLEKRGRRLAPSDWSAEAS